MEETNKTVEIITRGELIKTIVRFMKSKKLTDDDRLDIMQNFCTYCGGITPPECYCMKDD